jgi:hypothetical protein
MKSAPAESPDLTTNAELRATAPRIVSDNPSASSRAVSPPLMTRMSDMAISGFGDGSPSAAGTVTLFLSLTPT